MRTQSRKMEIREAHIQRVTTKTYGAQCARSRRPVGSRDGLGARRHWDRGCLRGVPRRARQDRPARRTDGGPPDRAPRPAFVRVAREEPVDTAPASTPEEARSSPASERARANSDDARASAESVPTRKMVLGGMLRSVAGWKADKYQVRFSGPRSRRVREARGEARVASAPRDDDADHPRSAPSLPPSRTSSTCKCTTRTTSSPARRRSRSCGSAETRPPPRRCARARYDPPPGRAPFAGALGPAPAPEAAPTFPPSR